MAVGLTGGLRLALPLSLFLLFLFPLSFCGAAWMGVQHLGYAEFDVASRVILRGNFRGVIHLQLELRRFERSMAEASMLDEVVKLSRSQSQTFGFAGVRFEINQLAAEAAFPEVDGDSFWALRVPLPHGQAIYLYKAKEAQMHPVVLSLFAQCLERQFTARLGSPAASDGDKLAPAISKGAKACDSLQA